MFYLTNLSILIKISGSHFGSHFGEKTANRNFSERLTKIRKKYRLSVAGLARKSGINESTIRKYEKIGGPNANKLNLLAKALNCTSAWLWDGVGPEPEPADGPLYNKDKDKEPDFLRVAAPEPEYDLHGGWQPRPEMQDEDHNMLGKAFEIIRSKSIYRQALAANINAFHGALVAEKTLEKQSDIIEEMGKKIDDLRLRIAVLERKRASNLE